MKEKFSNFRGLKKITVYEIHVNEGEGSHGDPMYREIYYVTEAGEIIGHASPDPLRKFAGEIE